VWGSYRLSAVKTVAVEAWLRTLSLAPGTKAKLRNIMSALFTHAMRYEWADRNPIKLVRQSAKRQSTPEVLTAEEIGALLDELEHDGPYYLIAFMATVTGLRASELLALRWGDLNVTAGEIHLQRGYCLSARRHSENGNVTEANCDGHGVVRCAAGLARTLPAQSRDVTRIACESVVWKNPSVVDHIVERRTHRASAVRMAGKRQVSRRHPN
jgi:hypothetical protein